MENNLPKNLYFTSNLKFLRRSRGLSQEALATALGLRRGNIVSYEKGLAEPNLRNLLAISSFLGVSIESLVKVNYAESMSVPGAQASTHSASTEETISKSNALGEVIRGIRAYHSLHDGTDDISKEQLAVDLDRCLEIADRLVSMNQALSKDQ